MHVEVLDQMVADRREELAASAHSRRARPLPPRRARRATGHAPVRREWRALLRALQAR
jgi:hypothetical protein